MVAGGASAKLGMNAKDHVKKGLPVLEDVVGGFAVVISEMMVKIQLYVQT